MSKSHVVMQPLRALKLQPGDILIIHFDKQPTDEQIATLKRQMTAESWGLGDIKFKILYGKFNLQQFKPTCKE